MKSKIILLLLAFIVTIKLNKAMAQSEQKALIGIVAGLDYGGLGLKGEFQPVKYLGIFAGFGYNFSDPAYNAGFSFKITPGKKICPTIVAMYGYNAVIKLDYGNGNTSGKTYYGPSVGAGCEVLSRDGKKNWTFEIFVPFRSSAFHDEYDALKNSGVEFSPDILPVTFTIGYNFSILAKAKNN